MAPRTLSLLGISKVMTVTSTYDHRIIQGAESGLFLARIEELLKGEDGFYERIFEDLKVAAPAGALGDRRAPRASSGPRAATRRSRSRRGCSSSSTPTACAATWSPTSTRSTPSARPTATSTPPPTASRSGTSTASSSRTASPGKDRATLREILEVLRDTYCGTIGVEYMYIADPERKEWLQDADGVDAEPRQPSTPRARRRVLEKLVEAESFERFLHAKYVGHKRFSLEGVRGAHPAARPRS